MARAQVPCFLSRDDITGYLVPKLTGDAPVVNQTHNYSKITINGGTVCRFLGVYEDISVIVYHYKKNSVSKKHRPDLYHPRIIIKIKLINAVYYIMTNINIKT